MAAALVYSLHGAWPARMSPMVTKGAVMSTPRAMLGTKTIPVASSRAYVMGASTSPASKLQVPVWMRTFGILFLKALFLTQSLLSLHSFSATLTKDAHDDSQRMLRGV